ncbi:porin [Candidatus Pelagibacter sp.]|jgi:outer membrane protein OmpU|nr:porin [Candidatus Pelagibacter sp.]
MNIKKIGLTALAGSLVATSAFAGAMSVTGGASINLEHINGGAADTGKAWSMGNQLTFSGSGELDNGLNVSLSFVLDQGDNADGVAGSAESPFDSHSVTISSDALGSLKFSGEGGSSATSALDTTAAGDIWDAYDIATTVHPTGIGGGSNSMFYTLPALMDGLSISASYAPTGSGAVGTEAASGMSATYTGVDGLSVSYGTGDGATANTSADALKASYAYGPITVAYSNYEFDADGSTSDDDTTSYKVSYTVSDEISISYGTETIERPTKEDVETSRISASYTAGGMTISATMDEIENMDGSTTATQDRERWALGASFAF